MKHLIPCGIIICLILGQLACSSAGSQQPEQEPDAIIKAEVDTSPLSINPWFRDGVDFPVGPPDGKGYYNAQGFGQNLHLGDDWNGLGGGNSDLGDPVYSIAIGLVQEAYDAGPGWGNVLRLYHPADSQAHSFPVEAIYAHLESMLVSAGDTIKRGQQIGTIGNADGTYLAHLHLEIRKQIGLPLGGGYATDPTGYLNPTRFIQEN